MPTLYLRDCSPKTFQGRLLMKCSVQCYVKYISIYASLFFVVNLASIIVTLAIEN